MTKGRGQKGGRTEEEGWKKKEFFGLIFYLPFTKKTSLFVIINLHFSSKHRDSARNLTTEVSWL